jgi:hypothetical protein
MQKSISSSSSSSNNNNNNTSADMRIARSCGYTSDNIGGNARLSPETQRCSACCYSERVGPQLLFLLRRMKIPVFVASFDYLAASCLSLLVYSRAGRQRRKASQIFRFSLTMLD